MGGNDSGFTIRNIGKIDSVKRGLFRGYCYDVLVQRKDFFSTQLKDWFKNRHSKTIADLIEVFGHKSFAVSLLILMFIPALPLPTGGITHIFEVVAILLSFEMVLGRKVIWLPKRWQKLDISAIGKGKIISRLIKYLHWAESHSKPRLRELSKNKAFLRITGIFLFIFCLTAFAAPPFSGLDTLPSMAVVIIALSLIFEDLALYTIGLFVGAIGIGVVLFIGETLLRAFRLL